MVAADFFVGRLADGFFDHVPNFDLTYEGLLPLSNLTYRDASAAAIAASRSINRSINRSISIELATCTSDGAVSDSSAADLARAQTYKSYAAQAIGPYASDGSIYGSIDGSIDRSIDFDKQEGAVTCPGLTTT